MLSRPGPWTSVARHSPELPANTTLTARSTTSFSLLLKSPLTTSRILSLPVLPTKRSLNGLTERPSRGRESRSSNGTMNGATNGSQRCRMRSRNSWKVIFPSLCPHLPGIPLLPCLTFITPRQSRSKPIFGLRPRNQSRRRLLSKRAPKPKGNNRHQQHSCPFDKFSLAYRSKRSSSETQIGRKRSPNLAHRRNAERDRCISRGPLDFRAKSARLSLRVL